MRAMMDYTGNGGSWGSYAAYTSASNSLDGPIVPSSSVSLKAVRVTDITSGSSNVLLIGEKYLDRFTAATHSDCNDDQGWTDGWDNDTICFARGSVGETASASTDPITPPVEDGAVGGCNITFGSPHVSVNVAQCDGSVRTVSFAVNPNNWLIFCQINSTAAIDWTSF